MVQPDKPIWNPNKKTVQLLTASVVAVILVTFLAVGNFFNQPKADVASTCAVPTGTPTANLSPTPTPTPTLTSTPTTPVTASPSLTPTSTPTVTVTTSPTPNPTITPTTGITSSPSPTFTVPPLPSPVSTTNGSPTPHLNVKPVSLRIIPVTLGSLQLWFGVRSVKAANLYCGKIYGKVTDAKTGRPIVLHAPIADTGIALRLSKTAGVRSDGDNQVGYSDAQLNPGSYIFQEIDTTGTYEIFIPDQGGYKGKTVSNIKPRSTAKIDFSLEKESCPTLTGFCGTVKLSDGRKASQAKVAVLLEGADANDLAASTLTDSDGFFIVNGLETKSLYSIRIEYTETDGTQWSVIRKQLQTGLKSDFILERVGSHINGQVFDRLSQKPVSGSVDVILFFNDTVIQSTGTDNGKFSFKNIPAGQLGIVVEDKKLGTEKQIYLSAPAITVVAPQDDVKIYLDRRLGGLHVKGLYSSGSSQETSREIPDSADNLPAIKFHVSLVAGSDYNKQFQIDDSVVAPFDDETTNPTYRRALPAGEFLVEYKTADNPFYRLLDPKADQAQKIKVVPDGEPEILFTAIKKDGGLGTLYDRKLEGMGNRPSSSSCQASQSFRCNKLLNALIKKLQLPKTGFIQAQIIPPLIDKGYRVAIQGVSDSSLQFSGETGLETNPRRAEYAKKTSSNDGIPAGLYDVTNSGQADICVFVKVPGQYQKYIGLSLPFSTKARVSVPVSGAAEARWDHFDESFIDIVKSGISAETKIVDFGYQGLGGSTSKSQCMQNQPIKKVLSHPLVAGSIAAGLTSFLGLLFFLL